MTPHDVEKLKAEIENRFEAEVDVEEVGPGRYRFGVVSSHFSGVPHLDRQDKLWALVDDVLTRATSLDISIILAFAPDELEQAA